MAQRTKSVRIGPISIVTLIIILCLAVMAVLSITTAHASLALTQRQAVTTTYLYQDEVAAQTMVSKLDEVLLPVRQSGGDVQASIAAVSAVLSQLNDSANENPDVQGTVSLNGSILYAKFVSPENHLLSVEIELNGNGTYQITSWITTVEWLEDSSTAVWTGSNN